MFIEVKLTGLSLGAISLGCDPAMWATLQWGVHEEEMKKALCSTFSTSSSPSSLTDQISMAETHTHTTIMLLISLELQIEINQTWQAAFIAARSIAGTVCCSINSSCRFFFFLFLLMMQLLSFFFLPFFSNCRRLTAVTINLAINCICLVWVESLQWSNYPFFSFSLCAFLSVFRLLFFSFTFKW